MENPNPNSIDPTNLISGPAPDQLRYEQAYAELEKIVQALEANQLPLDQALMLFERGQAMALRCGKLLDEAELKIQQISGDELADFNP